jgi:hypothetical protein
MHAIGIAFVGVLTDLSVQLSSPAAMNWPRTMIVGLVIGGLARLLGAYFASVSTTDAPSE